MGRLQVCYAMLYVCSLLCCLPSPLLLSYGWFDPRIRDRLFWCIGAGCCWTRDADVRVHTVEQDDVTTQAGAAERKISSPGQKMRHAVVATQAQKLSINISPATPHVLSPTLPSQRTSPHDTTPPHDATSSHATSPHDTTSSHATSPHDTTPPSAMTDVANSSPIEMHSSLLATRATSSSQCT